jgi:hypothetical protein
MAVLTTNIATAGTKLLTPEQVHSKLLKRGLGNWVGVEMQDGRAFVGRIISIDDQTFSLQLHNDPQVTAVFYSEVGRLETGPSRGTIWGIVAGGVGGMVALAVVGFHEVHEHDQLPALPTAGVK